MKVSDYIACFLKENQISCVFEVSGGMIAHLLDSFHQAGGIQIVSTHHEQAAGFAADAYGRLTGKPGIALATSGPGATNLITPIGSCYFDSSPAIFITGQVNRNELKGNRQIRQLGFQEADIVSMVKPITKAAWQVESPEEIPALLEKAYQIATSGRPGPVLIDIPMDIQRSNIDVKPSKVDLKDADNPLDPLFFNQLFKAINQSKKPLILAGGGIRSSRTIKLFRNFVKKVKVPTVTSLMGVGSLPFDDPFCVGMIGSYGNRWANLALGQSDFLLVLGSRLDVRQTGSETKAFKEGRNIFHVDCESGEMNNRVKGCTAFVSDLKQFLLEGLQYASQLDFQLKKTWMSEIESLREQWPDLNELKDIKEINPNAFMHKLSRASKQASCYLVDVGQHQMWAAQSLELGPDQDFLTSGGMGSMGFALPAAIGAAFVDNSRPSVVIAGDGGLQHNIHELQTIFHHKLPIKIIVLNNGCHGMVRQFQQSYFENRFQSTLWGYSAPDFERVAQAYGISAETLDKENDVAKKIDWLWKKPLEPALLQVTIDQRANAYPKIAFGRPVTEMEPLSSPLEIEGT